MNTEEVTMLLTRIQVLDNRQVDSLTIEAWEPLLERTEYVDAVEAVNSHFRTSDRYLLPAHVVEGAKTHKSRRVSRQSRIAAARIVELGGEKPTYWNGQTQATDDLARVGALIESADPRADEEVRAVIQKQREYVASLEAGRAWAAEHRITS